MQDTITIDGTEYVRADSTAAPRCARGVSWDRARKRYVASISIGNRKRFLGRFHEHDTAHEAYLAASRALRPGGCGDGAQCGDGSGLGYGDGSRAFR